MPETITCPHCRRRLQLPEEHSGSTVLCPSCRNSFLAHSESSVGIVPEALPCVLPVEEPLDVLPVGPGEYGDRSVRGAGSLRAPAGTWGARTSSRPVAKKSGKAWIFVTASVALVACLIAGIAALIYSPPSRSPTTIRVSQAGERRYGETKEAFRNQKPLTEEEIGRELRPLFEELNASFKAQNRERMLANFDLDRIYDELLTSEMIPGRLVGDRPEFVGSLRKWLGEWLAVLGPAMEWNSYEIRHIEKLEGNEAVVIVRHNMSRNPFSKRRWWVSKRSGTWKVYDWERLDMGIRQCTRVAMIVAEGSHNRNEISTAINCLDEAFVAVVSKEDADTADAKLKEAEKAKFPASLEAARFLMIGLVRLHRGQYKEALEAWKETRRLREDMPYLDLLDAIAYNRLGEPDKALKLLERYQGLLGEDPYSFRELGEALLGLQRPLKPVRPMVRLWIWMRKRPMPSWACCEPCGRPERETIWRHVLPSWTSCKRTSMPLPRTAGRPVTTKRWNNSQGHAPDQPTVRTRRLLPGTGQGVGRREERRSDLLVQVRAGQAEGQGEAQGVYHRFPSGHAVRRPRGQGLRSGSGPRSGFPPSGCRPQEQLRLGTVATIDSGSRQEASRRCSSPLLPGRGPCAGRGLRARRQGLYPGHGQTARPGCPGRLPRQPGAGPLSYQSGPRRLRRNWASARDLSAVGPPLSSGERSCPTPGPSRCACEGSPG